MNLNLKSACAAAAMSLMLAGPASAAIVSTATETGLFISVVSRDNGAITGNLVIDLGINASDFFDGTVSSWMTSTAQSAAIADFASNAVGTVSFNIGGAELVTNSENWGFISTGAVTGPGLADFVAFNTGVQNTLQQVSFANQGDQFDADGVLAASLPADPGFHGSSNWNNNIGGAVNGSNEILLGQGGDLTLWSLSFAAQGFVETALNPVTSDLVTGKISVASSVVPVPAAVWLFGSALGLLGWVRSRISA